MIEKFKIGELLSYEQAMQFAIELASRGVGYVKTNPPVGCVILSRDNKLLGFGYHQKYGEPHAEINAMNSIENKKTLEGSSIFVTLEPCSHTGKTPPCVDAILQVGVSKVFYALQDPNPLVSGRGHEKLQLNGVQVEKFELPTSQLKELQSLMAAFCYNMKEQKAFVTLKVAMSLDGFIAKDSGESQWITCDQAREHVHFLRGQHDAIAVGYGTVVADNPSLNIRHSKFKDKKLFVVVFDPNLKLLDQIEKINIFNVHEKQKIILVCDKDCKRVESSHDFNILALDHDNEEGFDLQQVWSSLYSKFNIGSVIVEGGAQTHSQLLKKKSFQQLCLYIGAKILGYDHSTSWTKGLDFTDLSQSLQLEISSTELIGGDNFLKAKLKS